MEDFGKYVSPEDIEDDDDKEEDVSNIEFKPFHKTFSYISFAMGMGFIYPNPRTEIWRIIAIPISIISVLPTYVLVGIDLYKCYQEGDIENIIRHTTVKGPFLAGFYKMILMYHKRIVAKAIIDEMDRDFAVCNTLSKPYKVIARDCVRVSKLYEKGWTICVAYTVSSFPLIASGLTVVSHLFSDEPKKYMIHDINVPFREPEARFESPYFELMFLQTVWCSALYYLNFLGYDGYLITSVYHSCLKMKLCVRALVDAMRVKDEELRWKQIYGVIEEQKRTYRYVDMLKETFHVWLGTITGCMVIHICTCVYRLQSLGFDMRYLAFTVASVIYVFSLCKSAGTVKSVALDTATDIYCCGWEQVQDQRVRKIIVFMIMRAQVPLQIKALTLYDFDMEMFVMLMKMAYSMFTLLQQQSN